MTLLPPLTGSAVHPSVTTVNVKEPLMGANTVSWFGSTLHPAREPCIRDTRPVIDALVAVQDNGRGIAPDVLPRIFEPFFTTKPVGQGTGLGLSICQQIVQAHGGRVAATSAAPSGTRFVVALPIAGMALPVAAS